MRRILPSWQQSAGHGVEVLQTFDEILGHAGEIVRYPDGTLKAGYDSRNDGASRLLIYRRFGHVLAGKPYEDWRCGRSGMTKSVRLSRPHSFNPPSPCTPPPA